MFCFVAAFEYLKTHPVDPIDQSEFSEACGVGVVVLKEEVVQVVMAVIRENEKELKDLRYKFNVGKIMGIYIYYEVGRAIINFV